jgi:hypothetical protein
MTGAEYDHTRNSASMKARDKTLATTTWLRDNAIVGMPDMVADRWRARHRGHGWQGSWAARNLGLPISLAKLLTSRRRGEMERLRVRGLLIPAPVGAVT